MTVKTKAVNTNSDNNVKLDVVVSGMVITVGHGSFRLRGEDFVLNDNYECTVAPSAEKRTVRVILAKEISSGEGVVVVDEEAPGDGSFPWDGSGYKPLHCLFLGNVPPDTTDLSDVEWLKLDVVERDSGLAASRKLQE